MHHGFLWACVFTFLTVARSDHAIFAQGSSSADLWDVSRGATVLGTSGLNALSDGRDMFGGNFASIESSQMLFRDGQPRGYSHFIEWKTAAPMLLESYSLFAAGDGAIYNHEREFSQFRLYARLSQNDNYELISWYRFGHPYAYDNASSHLLLSASVFPTVAQYFLAEFIQHDAGRGYDGPRVIELDGFGTWHTETPRAPAITSISNDKPTLDEDSTVTISLEVDDGDAAADSAVTLYAISNNHSLIPASRVVFSGSGSSRTVTITPLENANGSAVILLRAVDTDGLASEPRALIVTVRPSNDAPSIERLYGITGGHITVYRGIVPVPDPRSQSGLIEISVSDSEDVADALTVTASSSNQSLISDGNIHVSGSGSLRTISITPWADRPIAGSETAFITLVATDTSGRQAQTSFAIEIFAVNNPPSMDPIPDVYVQANSEAQEVRITGIQSGEGEIQSMTLTVTATTLDESSNRLLDELPAAPILVVDGSASFRFKPKPNIWGVSRLTVSVQDSGGAATSRTFSIHILAGNYAPLVAPIPDQGPFLSSPNEILINPIQLVISDSETPASKLIVVFTSDNQALIPDGAMVLQPSIDPGRPSLRIRLSAGVAGTAHVTVRVTDLALNSTAEGAARTASTTFKLTVVEDQRPVISPIADLALRANKTSPVIPFRVSDAQSPAASIVVSATSDNKALIPDQNVLFAGSGTDRLLIIMPASSRTGTARIAVRATDPDGNSSEARFSVTFSGQSPVINPVRDQEFAAAETTRTLDLTVSDPDGESRLVKVEATSSNLALISSSNLRVEGTGTARTLSIVSHAGQTGQTLVTLTATDSDGLTATTSFTVRVPNTPPTLSTINDLRIAASSSSEPVHIVVNDRETAPNRLSVRVDPDGSALLPGSGMALEGDGSTRTLIVTPAAGKSGTGKVKVVVSDGELFAAHTIVITVVDPGFPPVISTIQNVSTVKGSPTVFIPFTVSDVESPASNLLVAGTSSNQAVVRDEKILFGGSGAGRTLFIFPEADIIGSVVISVRVTDPSGLSATRAFTLSISAAPSRKTDDLNGDGDSDLVFQDSNGHLAAWFLTGTAFKAASVLSPARVSDAGWRVVGTGSFDPDAQTDLLFQHTDGTLAAWLMDGVQLRSAALLEPAHPGDNGWRVQATADLDRDGNTDLIFQHRDGTLAAWYMKGMRMTAPMLIEPSKPGLEWKLAAAADFDDDDQADLVFQHSDGRIAIWFMQNNRQIRSEVIAGPSIPELQVVAAADLNGDGTGDLVLEDRTAGFLIYWLMDGSRATFKGAFDPFRAGGTWKVVGP